MRRKLGEDESMARNELETKEKHKKKERKRTVLRNLIFISADPRMLHDTLCFIHLSEL